MYTNMKISFILILLFFGLQAFAQVEDTSVTNKVVIYQDYRLAILARKEADINTAILKAEARIGKGFRLMILNTNDREYAMKIRAELLQKYPEQKTYMWFANPYIKIKFGNFKTKEEADPYKKQITKLLNGATIYYLPETIEVKPDKDFNPDDIN
jgi:SPOR domain